MILRLITCFLCCGALFAQQAPVRLGVDLKATSGPMRIDRFGLGQAGLTSEPMWDDRIPEIRMLRPRVIRLFIGEYFDVLPEPGHYHWAALDRAVDTILRAGATPLLCITIKPKVLFPAIDQDLVEPTSWEAWETLIHDMVLHYRERNGAGWYWEIGNEPNHQYGGGTPYNFSPETYNRFYRHTAEAVLRADPTARVGGPALAGWDSEILPSLLEFCSRNKIPLHFVSWHGYENDPGWFKKSIIGVKAHLQKFPDLSPETVIDEWNMGLKQPVQDPRFQPCFIAETTYHMIEEGLGLSAYFHIRDYPVNVEEFERFWPRAWVLKQGTVFWERRPIYLGLFDFQNNVRPSYFLFKLLSRLTGDRVRVTSPSESLRALASHDPELGLSSVLVWNFSKEPAKATLEVKNGAKNLTARLFVLDSTGPSNVENQRIRPAGVTRMPAGEGDLTIELEAYGVSFVSLEEPD